MATSPLTSNRGSSSTDNDAVATAKLRAALSTNTDAIPLDALTAADKASKTDRLRTFRTSFRYLRQLSPQQVSDFMSSYIIYTLDWSDPAGMTAALGPHYRQRVGDCLRAYYGILNHLCALGAVEKMYIPPVMDLAASVRDNQLLYERAVARSLGLRSGHRVLDLGCGRGRVAAHMATAIPGLGVTGVNIDPDQIGAARAFSEERGLVGNEFLVRDFNDLPLPFGDEAFDGFYAIQALSLCKDLGELFREVYRVLKPGARVSVLDWVRLARYDEGNAEHAELMRRVKPLIGAVGTPTPRGMETALEGAGFVVVRSENASIDGLQSPLIRHVDGYFRALRMFVLAAVRLRWLPGHFKTLIDRLCLDGQAFVKMDEMRLITTSWWIVAEKPATREE